MSIKQRLKAAEKSAGIGSGVTISVFQTLYECENNQPLNETALANVSSRNRSITVCSIDGETFSDFEARVERACVDEFGNPSKPGQR